MKLPNLLLAATFGATLIGASAVADAKPNFNPMGSHKKPSKVYTPYQSGAKPYLSQYRYRQMRRNTKRVAVRDFRRIDRNRDGFITRWEYRPRYTRRSHTTRRSHYRPNRRAWRILLRKADFNRDGRISSREMTTMRMRAFESRIRRNYTMKRAISRRAFRRMMRSHRMLSYRSFAALDRNRDGMLTRRDFRTHRYPRYEWRRTSNRRRRVRRPIPRRVSPRWMAMVRTYDTNRDGRITKSEFVRVKTATYKRGLLAKYEIIRRSHRRPYRYTSF